MEFGQQGDHLPSGSQVEYLGLHPFHLTRYSVLDLRILFLVIFSAAKTISPMPRADASKEESIWESTNLFVEVVALVSWGPATPPQLSLVYLLSLGLCFS